MPIPSDRDDLIDLDESREPNGPDGEMNSSSDERRSPERIAQRAYERYQARGAEHGHDQEDWFEAEREFGDDERR